MPTSTADVLRVCALSDGVFAIAMTLLIFDLHVPELANHPTFEGLALAVAGLWEHFAAYAVSFLILGLYWVSHHLLFDLIRRSDRGLLWINMFFRRFAGV